MLAISASRRSAGSSCTTPPGNWLALYSATVAGILRPETDDGETTVTEPLADSVLEALRAFDTPTICNAMEIVAPERRLHGYTVKPLVSPVPLSSRRSSATRARRRSARPARRTRGGATGRRRTTSTSQPALGLRSALSRISTARTSATVASGARSTARCTRRSAASASSPTARSATSPQRGCPASRPSPCGSPPPTRGCTCRASTSP